MLFLNSSAQLFSYVKREQDDLVSIITQLLGECQEESGGLNRAWEAPAKAMENFRYIIHPVQNS